MTVEDFNKLTPFERAVLEYLRKIASDLDDIAKVGRE